MRQKGKGFRIVFNAPVVLGFTGLCLAAMLLSLVTKDAARRFVFSVYRSSLASPLAYLRFFGHVLGHMSWEHFFNNIMYILILGPMLEEKHGSACMLFLILITAFVTGLAVFLFAPGVAMCGASGIVFALILLSSFTTFQENTLPLTVILVAAIYTGWQIYGMVNGAGNVAYGAHLLGGLVGAAAGWLLNRRRGDK